MKHRSIFNRQTLAPEREAQQRDRRIRNYSLLLAVGALFGLCVPVSKIAVHLEDHPIGLTIWVNLIVAILCLGACVVRHTMPLLNWQIIRFSLLWAFYGSAIGEVLLFWIAATLPATTLSIILVCEGFFVYVIVACRGQKTGLRSLFGLTLGLFGVFLLIEGQNAVEFNGHFIWMLAALCIPMVYAIEDLLLADGMPPGLDIVACTGLSALAGVLMLLPIAWLLDDLFALGTNRSLLFLALCCLGLTSALGTVLMAQLLKQSGPVFGSLAGYTITAFGIFWAVLLLGEEISAAAIAATLLLVIGLTMVESRRAWPDAREDRSHLQDQTASAKPGRTASRSV